MKKLLLTLTIILFVVLLNFRFLVFNEKFYHEEFEKLGAYEKFGQEEVNKNTDFLISYLKNNQQLETEFFNEKEKLHLQDVKFLIDKTILLFYLTLILLITLLIVNRKNLAQPFLFSGIGLILLVIIFALLNFQNLFFNFHLIAFNNNLWRLNPETDNLINLFPEQFFYDFMKRVMINSLLVGIMLILVSFLCKKFDFRLCKS